MLVIWIWNVHVLLLLSLWKRDTSFARLEMFPRSLNCNWLSNTKNWDIHAKHNLGFGSLSAHNSLGSFLKMLLIYFLFRSDIFPSPSPANLYCKLTPETEWPFILIS